MGKRAQQAAPPETGKRLTIAISSGSVMRTPAAIALAVATRTTQCAIRLDAEESCYVHKNRNKLMARALASDSTHLLFLDEDIVFPADGIRRLFAAGKDVIGGAYNTRAPKNANGHSVTTVKPLAGSPLAEEGAILPKDRPFEVRAVATGFLLINLDTLRAMPAPEKDGGKADGSDGGGHPLWFDFGSYSGFVGEDVYFCDYVRNHGTEVWCDPTIPLGHIGTAVY